MTAIGFVLSNEQFPAPHLLDLGVQAEAAGFNMVWLSDHFHPWMHNQGHSSHAWILLAALGQRLSHIPFGTGVTCPTYRYPPAVVAQAFASLGVLYPGRVFLGVGTGEAVNEQAATGQWGDYDERHDRLVEAVGIIRELWCGDWVNHQGQYYTLQDAHLYDLPLHPIPIFIAAAGDQSVAMAGEYGDGLITDSGTALQPEKMAAFREGAQKAGKDPALLSIHAEHFVIVGDEDDAREAAEIWRFLPNAWTEFVDYHDPREILQGAQQQVELDAVMAKMTIGADAQTHLDAIHKLIDSGVTHLYIHSGQADQQRVIEFYEREVLPELQQTPIQHGVWLAPNV